MMKALLFFLVYTLLSHSFSQNDTIIGGDNYNIYPIQSRTSAGSNYTIPIVALNLPDGKYVMYFKKENRSGKKLHVASLCFFTLENGLAEGEVYHVNPKSHDTLIISRFHKGLKNGRQVVRQPSTQEIKRLWRREVDHDLDGLPLLHISFLGDAFKAKEITTHFQDGVPQGDIELKLEHPVFGMLSIRFSSSNGLLEIRTINSDTFLFESNTGVTENMRSIFSGEYPEVLEFLFKTYKQGGVIRVVTSSPIVWNPSGYSNAEEYDSIYINGELRFSMNDFKVRSYYLNDFLGFNGVIAFDRFPQVGLGSFYEELTQEFGKFMPINRWLDGELKWGAWPIKTGKVEYKNKSDLVLYADFNELSRTLLRVENKNGEEIYLASYDTINVYVETIQGDTVEYVKIEGGDTVYTYKGVDDFLHGVSYTNVDKRITYSSEGKKTELFKSGKKVFYSFYRNKEYAQQQLKLFPNLFLKISQYMNGQIVNVQNVGFRKVN